MLSAAALSSWAKCSAVVALLARAYSAPCSSSSSARAIDAARSANPAALLASRSTGV
jgi:hypothetical protein